jgi:hypothetical protein
MNSGSGESGSVQWDAAFRSRLYLAAPKKENEDDVIDPDARVLTRVKANYAARDGQVDLGWSDGVLRSFGSVEAGDRPDAETVFLTILDKMTAEGQNLSHNSRAGNYAPKLFTQRAERCGYKVRDFEHAMQSLIGMHEIRLQEYGKPSDQRQRLVRANDLPF